MMTDHAVASVVEEAIDLDRKIRTSEHLLKQLKTVLQQHAIDKMAAEGKLTKGHGVSVQIPGHRGNVALVTFPARKLKGKFSPTSKIWASIAKVAGAQLTYLFAPARTEIPVCNFRAEALRQLGPAGARRLLKLCESESKPTVNFETKEGK